MEQRLAQAAPTTGASNANDFQPTTQNPQTAPGSLQQGQLQGITNPQEFLNDNQQIQLSVAAEPAAAPPPKQPRSIAGYVLAVIIVIALGVLLYRFIKKKPAQKLEVSEVEPPTPIENEITTIETPLKPVKKQKPAKKSKRRNR